MYDLNIYLIIKETMWYKVQIEFNRKYRLNLFITLLNNLNLNISYHFNFFLSLMCDEIKRANP